MSMQDILEQIRSLLKKKKRGRISAISRDIPQDMLKKQNSKQGNEIQSPPSQSSEVQSFSDQKSGEQNMEGREAALGSSLEKAAEGQKAEGQKLHGQEADARMTAQNVAGGNTVTVQAVAEDSTVEKNTAGQSTEEQNSIERTKNNMTEYRGGKMMRVIPVYNMMVLPHSYIYFQVQSFKNIAGQEIRQDDHVLLAVLKEDSFNTKDLRKEEFHSVAVEGSVTEISGDGYVVVRTGQRVKILELAQKEGEPLLLETAP